MSTVQLHDKATINTRVVDGRGYLKVKATFSRVGIQRYTARELGLQGRPPGDILRILRPEEEVFAQDSLESFESVPVTNDHPPENVTPQNVKKYGVGITLGKRIRDGEVTTGEILIQDAQAIEDIQNGKAELSDGYACEIVMTPGVWNGQPYDGSKRNIRGNHTAIVGAGRCGGACRIQDSMCSDCSGETKNTAPCSCQGGEDMSGTGAASPQLVQRVVDGISIDTTIQGAQVVDRLQAQLSDALKATETARGALETAAAAHKTELETKDGEIAGLKAQVSDEALDARVAERASLVGTVLKVMGKDYDPKGKTNVQMMTDAAGKVYGVEAVKDRGDEYIKALYSTVEAKAKTMPDSTLERQVTDHLNAPNPQRRRTANMRDDAGQGPTGRDAYLARLNAGRDGQRSQHKD